MDNSQIIRLLSKEFRATVEQNIDRDPFDIALDRRVPDATAVATQVKYLKRAKIKLPTWYSVRCILPGRAFEQSSSEKTALRKNYSGRVAIDLTCGLGVDSWALSRGFEQVISLERDPELAAIARENFRRLGADNILVINSFTEKFIASPEVDLSRVDLVYVDPDRRSEQGKKMVRMEDCSPDPVALLPAIERILAVNERGGGRFVIKLSPLFDVAEIFRIFGSQVSVEVVSVGGECKEIIAEIICSDDKQVCGMDNAVPMIRAVAVDVGEAEYPFYDNVADVNMSKKIDLFEPNRYKFLVVPDVALQKARLARRYFSERGVWIDDDNGYGFALEKPTNFMGKVFDIQSIESFDPKKTKRQLKTAGVKNIDILKRNFPLRTDELTRALGLASGKSNAATLRIAFTSIEGKLYQITLV